MPQVTAKNRIIEKLINGGVLSSTLLKHHYRELCKATHPDLNHAGNEDFLRLQQEYREAREFLAKHKHDFPHLEKQAFYKALDPRVEFYNTLHYYTVCGLHSVRIRHKKELKDRNLKIIREVLLWARWYDRDFIPIFVAYNKPFLRSPAQGEVEKRLAKARRFFLNGLNWFFKYEIQGIEAASRTAGSYLADAIDELKCLDHRVYKQSLLQFAQWARQELELAPACR